MLSKQGQSAQEDVCLVNNDPAKLKTDCQNNHSPCLCQRWFTQENTKNISKLLNFSLTLHHSSLSRVSGEWNFTALLIHREPDQTDICLVNN